MINTAYKDIAELWPHIWFAKLYSYFWIRFHLVHYWCGQIGLHNFPFTKNWPQSQTDLSIIFAQHAHIRACYRSFYCKYGTMQIQIQHNPRWPVIVPVLTSSRNELETYALFNINYNIEICFCLFLLLICCILYNTYFFKSWVYHAWPCTFLYYCTYKQVYSCLCYMYEYVYNVNRYEYL